MQAATSLSQSMHVARKALPRQNTHPDPQLPPQAQWDRTEPGQAAPHHTGSRSCK